MFAFQTQLEPLILNIHGETEHVGKRPHAPAASSEQRTQLIRLRREMKEAVEQRGTYERASEFRDDIRQIEARTNRRLTLGRTAGASDTISRKSRMTWLTSMNWHTSSGEWLRGVGPSPISSSAAASGWPAIWPTFRSSAGPAPGPRADRVGSCAMRILHIQTVRLGYASSPNELEGLDRQFLVERQLISREHADSEGARGVAIDSRETSQPDDQRGRSPAHPGDAQRARPGKRLGTDRPPSTRRSSRK